MCAQVEEFSGDALEPPVPAGLRELSAPLDSLIEFLGIDEDLVEVAASASAPLKEGPSRNELAAWVQGLPANEKDDLLIGFLSESSERCRLELLQRLHRENTVAASHGAIEQRTVKNLLTAARVRADERARQLSAKRAADAARKKAKDEADRAVYLEGLAKREKAVWKLRAVIASVGVRIPGKTTTSAFFAQATISGMKPGLVMKRVPASMLLRAESSVKTVPAPTATSGNRRASSPMTCGASGRVSGISSMGIAAA